METKKQNDVLPIVVMIFLFGMISFVTNLASPMGDILKYQFNVPNWMGTLGVFANFIAHAIMGYPAGNMLQKYGYKKTALVAIAVGFIGVGIQTLSGSAQSFGVYLLGAFIAGFSMCLLNTVVNPMLNKLGGGGNKGNQLIQAGGSFNSLCGTAVIILTGLLIPEGIKNAQISNVFPLMYAALAIFAFAFIVISLTKIPETNKEAGVKTAEASKYGPLSFRHFMLGAIAIFVYVGIEVGIPNVLQKWLQNPDLNVLGSGVNAEAVAGSVAATYWFLMLIPPSAGRRHRQQGVRQEYVDGRFLRRSVAYAGCDVRPRGGCQPARLQRFRRLRTGERSRQRGAAGADRSLHFGHVGRHLQPRRRRAGQIHREGFGYLHGAGLRRRYPAPAPECDR